MFWYLLSVAYAKYESTLLDEYDAIDNHLRMKALSKVSKDLNGTSNQLVLTWMMRQEVDIIPIISASKIVLIN